MVPLFVEWYYLTAIDCLSGFEEDCLLQRGLPEVLSLYIATVTCFSGKGVDAEGNKIKADKEAVKKFRECFAKLGDVFCSDAFGTAHRDHSSMMGDGFPVKCSGPFSRESVKQRLENTLRSQQFLALFQRIAKGAGGKGPRQKTSKIVKKCQKVFRHFSTIFAQGKNRQKSSKSVKMFFNTFRPLSRGTIFPAPFGGLRVVAQPSIPTLHSLRLPSPHSHEKSWTPENGLKSAKRGLPWLSYLN